MRVEGVPILCDQLRDVVGMSSLKGRPVEEFGISFALL
jgi:hypothetical protein